MVFLWNVRIIAGALLAIYGAFGLLISLPLFSIELFLNGLISLGIGYFLIFHIEKIRRNNTTEEVERLTNEKVLSYIPASHRGEKYKIGSLVLTQNNLVFNLKKENYVFPLANITSIGSTKEGTGNFVSTMQQYGNFNTISSVELKNVMFYLEGIKNDEPYVEYFYCYHIWSVNKAMKKFLKDVSNISGFKSSLEAHKA